MKIFECTCCRDCCKFNEDDSSANHQIFVYPEETDILETIAKIKEVPITLVEDLPIPDKKNQKMIVSRYILQKDSEEQCPFLKANKCIAYDQRPLVCRAYPLVISTENFIEHKFSIDYNCPALENKLSKRKKLQMNEIKELFPIEYRELLKIFHKEKAILKKINTLENDGKINLSPDVTYEEFEDAFKNWERFIVYTDF